MPKSALYPEAVPFELLFQGGVMSSIDPMSIPKNRIAAGVNIQFTDKGYISQANGQQRYNQTPIASTAPIKGACAFIGEDGVSYMLMACNGGFYWSNGNGTMTAVQYYNDATAVTIDTAYHWYNFQEFWNSSSGTQKKVVFAITDAYPVSTNTNGTHATMCTVSRAIYFYLASGVVCAKNVFYNSGTAGGTDDIQVGASTDTYPNSWPKNGKYICRMFDKIVVVNYLGATNGYAVSQAKNSLLWENASGGIDIGGGTFGEPYTGCLAYNQYLLLFTRHAVCSVLCTSGDLSTWQEQWLPTNLGNVGNQISINNDGWAYFWSEQGLARTNGLIVERVDTDIEDSTSNLAQLLQNNFSLALSGNSEWKNGTIVGTNNVDTTQVSLLQNIQNTQAQWQSGTNNQADLISQPGSVLVQTTVDQLVFYPNATLVTETIDYGEVPTTYGQFSAQVSCPIATLAYASEILSRSQVNGIQGQVGGIQGSSIFFWYLTSPDGITWSAPIFLVEAVPGTNGWLSAPLHTPTTRYLKIQMTLNSGYALDHNHGNAPVYITSPIVYALALGGQWVSRIIDLTATPSAYGIFDFDILAQYGNVAIEMNTSANSDMSSSDGFSPVYSGQVPKNTLRRYIQFRASLTINSYPAYTLNLIQLLPQLAGMNIQYFLGSNNQILPSVFCWNDRIYAMFQSNNSPINSNDSVWVGETRIGKNIAWVMSVFSGIPFPQWSLRDFVQATCMFVYKNQLMSGDSLNGYVNYQELGNINVSFMYDDFDRPSNNTTLGTATSGQTYTYGDVGGGGDTDVFGIQGGVAYCVNANILNHIRYAEFDTGISNCNLTCSFPKLNPNQGLIFRFIDANNYMAVYAGPAVIPGQYEYFFQKVISGVSTVTVSGAVGAASDGDEMRIYMSGTTVQIFVNRQIRYSTVVTNTTGTKMGLYLAGTGYVSSTWANFSVNFINTLSTDYVSYIYTPALSVEDADAIFRFMYLYYSAAGNFEVAWRTRRDQNDWSVWSDDPSINQVFTMESSPNISRSLKQVFPGMWEGVAIQLKIVLYAPDDTWGLMKMNVYAEPREVGR